MKCLNCGAELSNDSKFCSYCGGKIETLKESDNKENSDIIENKENNMKNDRVPYTEYKIHKNSDAQKKSGNSGAEKLKNKIFAFWKNADLFCRIVVIAIIIASLFLISSVNMGNIIPAFISFFQLVGLVSVLLLHTEKIKIDKKWLKIAIFSAVILLSLGNIAAYSKINNIAPDTTILEEDLNSNTPYGMSACVGKKYKEVEKDFKASGFTNIAVDGLEDLEISESEKYNIIESVSINGLTDFDGNTEFKSSAKIVIKYHSYKPVNMPLSSKDVKNMDTDSVLKALEEAGFINISTDELCDLDPDESKAKFENEITVDNKIQFEKDDSFLPDAKIKIVTHRPFEKYTLKLIIDFIPNLLFSTYDVKLEVDDKVETLPHGKNAEFEYRLEKGKYIITFSSKISSDVEESVEIDLNGDTEASYKIQCYEDRIDVETLYVENKNAIGKNEAMVPYSASNCAHKNYKEIKKQLKEAGFTNISTEIVYDIAWGLTEEGEVKEVSINGKTDFIRGEIYKKNVPVVITYHMNEEDDPKNSTETNTNSETEPKSKDESCSFSTNSLQKAKQGKSGVFAYRSIGGTYYNYYIIDFDTGFVYYFTEGNGNEICDKVKIVSGTLNDTVIITYHDGDTAWSEGLHFKWKNQPDHLVLEDNDHFEYDFYPTDLKDALKIRDSKKINNY